MLKMSARGRVIKHPEMKISQKGTQFLKFTIEVPAAREGQWSKRVYLTAFGNLAKDFETKLFEGSEVEVEAEPSARAYLDKMNKPTGLLEGIARSIRVLSSPKVVIAPQPQQETFITEDDIPF